MMYDVEIETIEVVRIKATVRVRAASRYEARVAARLQAERDANWEPIEGSVNNNCITVKSVTQIEEKVS